MNSQRSTAASRGRREKSSYHGGLNRQSSSYVPSTRQVIPGAAVSIVLKEDQPTGHEVQGVVQDILTRGEHPRGIKVRMTDGRIGRVQRMDVGTNIVDDPTEGRSSNFPIHAGRGPMELDAETGSRAAGMRSRDIRVDEPPEGSTAAYDLSAFIRPAKVKKVGFKSTENTLVPDLPESASCPVCGDFEGDEAAVAYHVEMHFT